MTFLAYRVLPTLGVKRVWGLKDKLKRPFLFRSHG
jgi:hypothetical protein